MLGCEKAETALKILRRNAGPDIRDLQKRVKLLEALVIELAVAASGELK